MSEEGFVYILASKPNGTLYIGVTSDIVRRLHQHRNGEGSDFVEKYDVTRLVHLEHFDDIEDAIRREKQLKPWRREWKLELIREHNPTWDDLSEEACRTHGPRWSPPGCQSASSPPRPTSPHGRDKHVRCALSEAKKCAERHRHAPAG